MVSLSVCLARCVSPRLRSRGGFQVIRGSLHGAAGFPVALFLSVASWLPGGSQAKRGPASQARFNASRFPDLCQAIAARRLPLGFMLAGCRLHGAGLPRRVNASRFPDLCQAVAARRAQASTKDTGHSLNLARSESELIRNCRRHPAGNRALFVTQRKRFMTLKVTQESAKGRRNYTGTVTRGKHKGETVTANVPDCGYGWKLFWDKVETHFGQKCYTA